MDAIVMNTLNGAVTEYDGFPFQSITPDRAGSAVGLYALGGENDAGIPIEAEFLTPTALMAKNLRVRPEIVFFSMAGTGQGALLVKSPTARYTYRFQVLRDQVSRAKPGLGIRESYLGFGFANAGGADFSIDQIEAQFTVSSSRRTE